MATVRLLEILSHEFYTGLLGMHAVMFAFHLVGDLSQGKEDGT